MLNDNFNFFPFQHSLIMRLLNIPSMTRYKGHHCG